MKKSKSNTVTIGGIPPAFKQIELACESFASIHANLASNILWMESKLASVRRTHLPLIRAEADHTTAERNILRSLIDNNRPLFDKPRTRVFSDIKVGLQKQKGEILFEDEEKSIALVAKHFPDRLDDLAPAKRKLSKTALANLTATELKKIGVEITADTDAVLIKPQDSDVEKAVAALLKENETQPLKAAA